MDPGQIVITGEDVRNVLLYRGVPVHVAVFPTTLWQNEDDSFSNEL